MVEIINVCEEAARVGGQVLLDWAGRVTVREKGPADLVTEADLAAQEAVRHTIADSFPGHHFIGEEMPGQDVQRALCIDSDEYVWIVDPLDGTTNYAHNVPHYACSVAVARQGAVLAGSVFNPVADECYCAERGQGATLNGSPIRASSVQRLADALVAASFPPRVSRDSPVIRDLLNICEHAQAIRRSGSAALNMCYVAAGRYDAYWATETKIWDVAAGWLLVREAGGVVRALDGGEFHLERPQPVTAATSQLGDELIRLLDRHSPP